MKHASISAHQRADQIGAERRSDSLGPDPEAMTDEADEALPSFETIKRYWNDPVFRDEIDAERARNRATANAAIDASIARYRARHQA